MYIAMLLLVTLALPSCEVDLSLGNHTLEYRERTAYLCSSDWQDDWYDAFYTSIRLNYGGGDYSYMDHIQLGNGRLECQLDGAWVSFYNY